MMKKKKFLAFLIALAFIIPICNPIQADAALKIKIKNTSITLAVGKTQTISLIGITTKQAKAVKWSSNKKTIATVSSTGKITAKKVGTAIITGKYKGKSYKCKVTVRKAQRFVKISKNKITLNKGESITINASVGKDTELLGVSYLKGSGVTVRPEKKSTGSFILTIKSYSSGHNKIKIYDKNKTSTYAYIEVNVVSYPTKMWIFNTELNLEPENTFQLDYSISPYDVTETMLTWKSSNPAVATVDDNGKVTAVSMGATTITATTCNGKKDSCKIIVSGCVLELPETPLTINKYDYKNNIDSSVEISSISIKEKEYYKHSDAYSISISINGKNTYGSATISSKCFIGYKLYDNDGFVVQSGTMYSSAVTLGEQFKLDYMLPVLSPGYYKLVLLDVK